MGLMHKRDMRKQPEHDDRLERPSRTEKKKAAESLQELGERLVTLSDEQLARIGLEQELLDAVRAARAITKHGARSRQMQYIGSLMRRYDPAPVQEFFAALDAGRNG
jgi:ribosome-associated protein